MEQRKKLISVITPVFNEEDNVQPCYDALRGIMASQLPPYDYEHIFCDNYSSDRTVELLRAIAAKDARVRLILNSRNFGPFCNTFNGLLSARGDAIVVLLAADLQDPPEVIVEFVRQWEQGCQVVYGRRKQRQEGWAMRAIRKAYYRVVTRFADFEIPTDVGEFTLIDRCVQDALRKFDDYYPYIRGMIANCGFRSTVVEYTWLTRQRGMSKNRLYHLIDMGLNGLISFSKVPLRLAMLSGFVLAALSLVWALVNFLTDLIFYRKLAAPGIATLIVAIFFFAGVQLFLIGILGEYIGAIHSQVRKRPLVIERERVNFGPAPTDDVSPAKEGAKA